MRVLVTGFSNFGTVRHNPSEQLVRELAAHYGNKISTHVFRGGYRAIDAQLAPLLAGNPDVVVMLGLASRSVHLRLERYATRPTQIQDGPERYDSTLPLDTLQVALAAKHIPVGYSDSAGSYYCNYVFYKVCKAVETNVNNRHGFIHIPDPAKSLISGSNLLAAGKVIVDELLRPA